MDERELLVLGLLRSQSQHGYQINEFIDKNLGRVTDMKKATAYSILKRLHQSGYVEVEFEQEGNRPQRQVYTITPAGEEKFLALLRESLSYIENTTPSGNIGIMFLDHLPQSEVIECLTSRLVKVNEMLKALEQVPPHKHGVGVDLALDHRLTIMRCNRDWLENTIKKLSNP